MIKHTFFEMNIKKDTSCYSYFSHNPVYLFTNQKYLNKTTDYIIKGINAYIRALIQDIVVETTKPDINGWVYLHYTRITYTP